MTIFRRKFSYSLFTILLLLIFLDYCHGAIFESSEPCQDVNGKDLNCPSNFIYYFECCANECCLRTQVVPAIIIGIGACVMTLFCMVSCIAYCCCGD